MNQKLQITKKFIYLSALVFVVLFSVGYSALSTNLYVSGNTKYRTKKDIRITDVTLTGVTGGGVEQFNPSYTSTTVTLGTSFSSSGTVTYQVEITNYTDTEYNISYSVSSNNTYTVTENYINPVGEGVYTLNIELSNSSGTDSATVTIVFQEASNKLYDVLKFAAQEGTYARQYTGSHQDSMNASLSTENIYHWYGSNNTNGTAITNMYNVIFANHCWQMMRTTDTGGVKLIYNGEADNNQCLTTRSNHEGFSSSTTQTLNSNYYYGTDYTFDGTNFTLSGTVTSGTIKVGQYTCLSTASNGTCTTLYLVYKQSSGSSYTVFPLSSTNYYGFGSINYSNNSGLLSNIGYMYNTGNSFYSLLKKGDYPTDGVTASTSYWYADSYTYNNGIYTLINPFQVSSADDFSSLVGKYTLQRSTSSGTSNYIWYLLALNENTNTSFHAVELTSGNNNLSQYNYVYTYGDSYTDNGNGTYTINNPSTINAFDWHTDYENIGNNKYMCKNATNNICSDLWYIIEYSYARVMYLDKTQEYKYAKGFTWNGAKYTLDSSTTITALALDDTTVQESLDNAHYSCFNTSGECSTLYYIFYYDFTNIHPHYIELNNGQSVEGALTERLEVNTYSSFVKTAVDAWYKKYIYDKGFDSYVEDTIYCNNRTIRNLGGWNPDGGSMSDYIQFQEYYKTSDLSCAKITDKFSTNNSNAQLTYKVGLLTRPEIDLLNNGNIRKSSKTYWLMSPYRYDNSDVSVVGVNTSGSTVISKVTVSNSIRPAISLIPGIEFVSGNGSKETPYIIDAPVTKTLSLFKSNIDSNYTYIFTDTDTGISYNSSSLPVQIPVNHTIQLSVTKADTQIPVTNISYLLGTSLTTNNSSGDSLLMSDNIRVGTILLNDPSKSVIIVSSTANVISNYGSRTCSVSEIAMTGTISNYKCFDVPRNQSFKMQNYITIGNNYECHDVANFTAKTYGTTDWGMQILYNSNSFTPTKAYYFVQIGSFANASTTCLYSES